MAPRSDEQGISYLHIEEVQAPAEVCEAEKTNEAVTKIIEPAMAPDQTTDPINTDGSEFQGIACFDLDFLTAYFSGSPKSCSHCSESISYLESYMKKDDGFLHTSCEEEQKGRETVKKQKSLVLAELTEKEQASTEAKRQADEEAQQKRIKTEAKIQAAHEAKLAREEAQKHAELMAQKKRGFISKMLGGRKKKATSFNVKKQSF